MTRIWLLFAGTSALYFLAGNEADNDLWVHLLLGKDILSTGTIPRVDHLSFTASGAAWVDHEWLAQALFALVYDLSGASGLWLTKSAIGLAAAWLIWIGIRRSEAPTALGVFVMVLTLACLSRGFAVRPQIFTYLFVPALLLWLDTMRNKPPAAAIPIVALWMCAWSNLHGAFIVGLGIVGLWSISPPWRHLPARLVLPAVALAAACINPYGPYLFTYIWGELSMPHPLTEWQPVTFGDPAHWPFWTMLIATAVTLPFGRMVRASPWRAALLVVTTYLALRHQRHVPLFAICAAAPLADQIAGLAVRARGFELSQAALRIVGVAVLAMSLLQLGLLATRTAADGGTIVYQAEDYPVGAVRYARENHLEGNLALPLDWGAYALWHLSPAMRVSMDGRFATVYTPPVVEKNFDFFSGVDDDLLTEHRADYVLNFSYTTLEALQAHGYRPIFRDRSAVLYGKQPAAPPVTADTPRGRLPFP